MLENKTVIGDYYDDRLTEKLYRAQDINEAMQLLRERMPHRDFDDWWVDAIVQKDYCERLDRILDRVADDDYLELGKQIAALRDDLRREFVGSVDTKKYGFVYGDVE